MVLNAKPAAHSFPKPSQTQNYEGSERRVGLELELTGVSHEEIASIVVQTYGGFKEKQGELAFEVKDTELGDFRIETDLHHVKKIGENSGQPGILRTVLEWGVSRLDLIPTEIVMPPIRLSNLHRTEELREQLRKKGAQGTSESWTYAFGLHINPEAVSLEIDSILLHLQAYLLRRRRLKEEMAVNLSRDISPFINPFPEEYIQIALQEKYQPDLGRFIDDYLTYNPTRNRRLDLLPLLTYLDSSRVTRKLAAGVIEKTNPRPTYHFRLPNSHVGDPDWRFADSWELWLGVEHLAESLMIPETRSRLLKQ
jgi:hypothetical protein